MCIEFLEFSTFFSRTRPQFRTTASALLTLIESNRQGQTFLAVIPVNGARIGFQVPKVRLELAGCSAPKIIGACSDQR